MSRTVSGTKKFQKQSNAVLKRTMGAFDVFLANVQMTAKDLGFTSYS